MASGSHYAAYREFPAVCGMDGVGLLDDGTRVFFAGPQPPYGSMAERTVVHRARNFPIPPKISDESPQPLLIRLIRLGSTCLARAACAGRDRADPRSDRSHRQTRDTNGQAAWGGTRGRRRTKRTCTREPSRTGSRRNHPHRRLRPGAHRSLRSRGGCCRFRRHLDYLWGAPTEALLAAIMRKDLSRRNRIRLVEVGESAGPRFRCAGESKKLAAGILGAGTGSAPTSPRCGWKRWPTPVQCY